jgi:O-antigen ligase
MCRSAFFSKDIGDTRRREECDLARGREETDPGQHPINSYVPSVITDILIAAIFLSLALQYWSHRGIVGLWPILFDRAVLGYGDPWYFLTSAFLWLQGLFYFRVVYAKCVAFCDETAGSNVELSPVAMWVRPVFAGYGVTMAVFLLFQYIYHIPEGWAGAGFQSPFEDISSFGSIAVTLFIFTVATLWTAKSYKLTLDILGGVSLLAMVVASWSRATWLAGSVFLLLIAVFRLPRIWTIALILGAVSTVVIINANSNRPSWLSQPYLARLVTLARLENPANKDSDRVNLYKKAARMIRQRPLVGHGIGSFYLTSLNYAQPGDPYATLPDFAHNTFLQIAAEQGVPIAALFTGLITIVLCRGFRNWHRRAAKGPQSSAAALRELGVSLALGAYLQTQMTANSLNVYVSNQFFFWFLLAAILALSANEQDPEAKSRALA